jgi:hypothetical protein
MSRIAWFKIGAVAALWAIIAVAAGSGWLIGRGDAARQISDLRQRLSMSTTPKQSCGVELELLEARTDAAPRATNLAAITLSGISPGAPRHWHLRQMLTSR